MPQALSVAPEPYQHTWKPGDNYADIITGWAHPPKDHKKWEELVYQWVTHCVDRYGKEEVETWYWEVWNEADIFYWAGQPRNETFHRLHDHAINGVKRALPTARVGGPDSAYVAGFLRSFLDHCVNGTNYATGEKGTPIDFIAFHAKGSPSFVDPDRNDDVPGFGRMGMAQQLNAINNQMRVVAEFPELRNTPIIIGESDPDGCAACRAIEYPANIYRNKSHFASYTAASFARKHELADRNGVNLEGALSWTFTFEDQPYFAGLRSLATNGIDKPVLNTFRMMSKMSGQRLAVESSHGYTFDEINAPAQRRGGRGRGARRGDGPAEARGETPQPAPASGRTRDVRGAPDVHSLASLEGNKLAAMVWHYHADDVPADAAAVELTFANLPQRSGRAAIQHFRIDDEHSNAYTVWLRMGSPQQPTPEQYAELEKSGKLAQLDVPATVVVENGQATVRFELPRQGVSLVVLQLNGAAAPPESNPAAATPAVGRQSSSAEPAAASQAAPREAAPLRAPAEPAASRAVERSLLVAKERFAGPPPD
jgi:xylan 1,4-beta-xylosidase